MDQQFVIRTSVIHGIKTDQQGVSLETSSQGLYFWTRQTGINSLSLWTPGRQGSIICPLDTRETWVNSLSLWTPGRHGSLDFIFEHHTDRNLQFETTEHQEEMDQQFVIRTPVIHGSTGCILENLAVKDQQFVFLDQADIDQ
jgi:hypothetical protein